MSRHEDRGAPQNLRALQPANDVVRNGKKAKSIEIGSGNVFTDLGFNDAGDRRLRVELAMRLNEVLAERELTQTKTAELLGIPQPHVSELKNYRLSRFSSPRLLHFLTRLDRDVEIVIRPKAKKRGSGLLTVSSA